MKDDNHYHFLLADNKGTLMEQSYILVESVNIYANVFDTKQLSVIRGSSLLLKQAIDEISTAFSQQLQAVSTGASSGLFILQDGANATELSDAIVTLLNKPDKDFNLFTFIVEYCRAESLLQAKEQLRAQLRIQQMHSITIVPDFIEDNNPELAYPDTLEGRRIATEKCPATIQNQKRQLSYSVYRRWNKGRYLKQNYYFQLQKQPDPGLVNQLKQYKFSQSFVELADNTEYSKLNAKMAVVYIDGNQFSKIQTELLKEADDQIQAQQAFDQKVQQYRADFLLKLLVEMIDESPGSRFQNALQDQQTLRFETLLWGGDEMLFVLPAWLGFEFMHYFFAKSAEWEINNTPLTHAAGMVFCSANTPIDKIRQLAESLAETVKNTCAENSPNHTGGRKQNAWGYKVLESIDYPSNNNIADFNRQHYGTGFNKPTLIPATSAMEGVREELNQLINKNLFPRRQLYRLVQTLNTLEANTATLSWQQIQTTDKASDSLTALERQEIRLLEVAEERQLLAVTLANIARELFGLDIELAQQRLIFWVYLYDLWDYLYPQAT